MDLLSKIFQTNNGDVRLKILRFFLAHPSENFTLKNIEEKLKIKNIVLKKEISTLLVANFIEKKIDAKKNTFYKINFNYPHKETLNDFIFDFKNINKEQIFKKFENIGRIKYFIFTGIFNDNIDVDLDILIVCDVFKEKEIEKSLQEVYTTFGGKLRVMILDLEDFEYRHKMYDRFLHLILDTPKIIVIDKISQKIY